MKRNHEPQPTPEPVTEYLRDMALVVMSRYIEPENGPGDARATNYGPFPCDAAGFEAQGDAAVNAVAIRFKHQGPTPPSSAQYIGVIDQVGRLFSVLHVGKREPDATGDIVFEAGTFRIVND